MSLEASVDDAIVEGDADGAESPSGGLPVVEVGPVTFDRLCTRATSFLVPLMDYAEVVARTPQTPQEDRYGVVASLKVGPALFVTGVGKARRERTGAITQVEKVLLPGAAPRMQRLRLRLSVLATESA